MKVMVNTNGHLRSILMRYLSNHLPQRLTIRVIRDSLLEYEYYTLDRFVLFWFSFFSIFCFVFGIPFVTYSLEMQTKRLHSHQSYI